MLRIKSKRDTERGATLVEFAIGATVFLAVLFAVLEFGRALWLHNALTDAARRGARYAVVNSEANSAQIQNVVVYGNPAGTGTPLINNLSTTNVAVNHSTFGVGEGTVSVSITNYQFQFVVPLIGTTINMPAYKTSLTGESAGWIPADK